MTEKPRLLTLLDGLTVVVLLIAVWLVFSYAPLEVMMGAVQKVFYFHVATAWVGMLGFLVAAVAGIVYLVSRVAGKVIGIWAFARWHNMTTNIRRHLGMGMIVQAGVAIGLIDIINRTNPELGHIVTPIILATVLIYETVGPPVIRYVLIKSGDVDPDNL